MTACSMTQTSANFLGLHNTPDLLLVRIDQISKLVSNVHH
mgnify:CR=1 FL=1